MTVRAKEEEKIRLNLAITPRVKEQIEELQRISDASSVTEVLRRALAVYHLLADHRAGGGSIILKGPDGTEEKLVIL